MDRVIALLAALIGLIALGGAVVVHTNVDAERQQMATDLAQMKLAIGLTGAQPPVVQNPAKTADDGTAGALSSLQDRVATLEQTTRDQADQLKAAKDALAAQNAAAVASAPASASAPAPASEVAAADPAQSSSAPAALSSDGPTKDCIPLGTRFMASSGDNFPICKTKVVVKVASVDDGSVIIDGPGPVAAGGFAALPAKGCQVMVLSADTSGYAEMRVTCD